MFQRIRLLKETCGLVALNIRVTPFFLRNAPDGGLLHNRRETGHDDRRPFTIIVISVVRPSRYLFAAAKAVSRSAQQSR
jgi:hypothetical protein